MLYIITNTYNMFMMTDVIRMTISNTRPTIVPLLICTRLVLSTINGVELYEILASCVLHDTPTHTTNGVGLYEMLGSCFLHDIPTTSTK